MRTEILLTLCVRNLTLHSYCWIIYYCTRIEVSECSEGVGVGGEGEWVEVFIH